MEPKKVETEFIEGITSMTRTSEPNLYEALKRLSRKGYIIIDVVVSAASPNSWNIFFLN